MAKSRLRELREREGLTATELARLSDVSTRTIKRLEKLDDPAREQVTEVTKYKVINGLNDARLSKQRSEFGFPVVFPEDVSGDNGR